MDSFSLSPAFHYKDAVGFVARFYPRQQAPELGKKLEEFMAEQNMVYQVDDLPDSVGLAMLVDDAYTGAAVTWDFLNRFSERSHFDIDVGFDSFSDISDVYAAYRRAEAQKVQISGRYKTASPDQIST